MPQQQQAPPLPKSILRAPRPGELHPSSKSPFLTLRPLPHRSSPLNPKGNSSQPSNGSANQSNIQERSRDPDIPRRTWGSEPTLIAEKEVKQRDRFYSSSVVASDIHGKNGSASGGSPVHHILASLSDLTVALNRPSLCIRDRLSIQRILTIHDEFIAAFSQGEASDDRVIGAPLPQCMIRFSCPAMIGGKPRALPFIVFDCVERLYQSGLTRNDLFRDKIDTSRVTELVDIYNTPSHGAGIDLNAEAPGDVFGVLYSFLALQPESVADGTILDALMEFCVSPQEPVSEPFRAARILIQMLPDPCFNILVYVTAFVCQVPLTEGSELDFKMLSAMFGPALLGSRSSKTYRGWSAIAYRWMLENWNEISDHIFDYAPPSYAIAGKSASWDEAVENLTLKASALTFDDQSVDCANGDTTECLSAEGLRCPQENLPEIIEPPASDDARVELLKKELESVRLERDAAMDVLETMRKTLRI